MARTVASRSTTWTRSPDFNVIVVGAKMARAGFWGSTLATSPMGIKRGRRVLVSWQAMNCDICNLPCVAGIGSSGTKL